MVSIPAFMLADQDSVGALRNRLGGVPRRRKFHPAALLSNDGCTFLSARCSSVSGRQEHSSNKQPQMGDRRMGSFVVSAEDAIFPYLIEIAPGESDGLKRKTGIQSRYLELSAANLGRAVL